MITEKNGWIVYQGESFEGPGTGQPEIVNLLKIHEGKYAFIDCEFNGWNSFYCVEIEGSAEKVLFERCVFRGATKKAVKAQNASFRRCLFEDLVSDGIFGVQGGNVEVVGCRFRRLGLDPEAPGPGLDRYGRRIHSDPIQVPCGSNWVIRNNYFQVPHIGAESYVSNSCVFIELR